MFSSTFRSILPLSGTLIWLGKNALSNLSCFGMWKPCESIFCKRSIYNAMYWKMSMFDRNSEPIRQNIKKHWQIKWLTLVILSECNVLKGKFAFWNLVDAIWNAQTTKILLQAKKTASWYCNGTCWCQWLPQQNDATPSKHVLMFLLIGVFIKLKARTAWRHQVIMNLWISDGTMTGEGIKIRSHYLWGFKQQPDLESLQVSLSSHLRNFRLSCVIKMYVHRQMSPDATTFLPPSRTVWLRQPSHRRQRTADCLWAR